MRSKLAVVDLGPSTAVEAARLRCRYADLPMADAVIAATAVKNSCEFVITDDKHIGQIRELKTKWI